MEHPLVICDAGKCTGCGICELVCSMEKEKVINPLFSRIHSVRLSSIEEPISSISVTCMQCKDPLCINFCPRKALTMNEDNGTIIVEATKCNGCTLCIAACEFGAISINPDTNIAIVCDLCDGDPKCVELCPYEALSYETFEKFKQEPELVVAKLVLQEFFDARENPKTFFDRMGFLPIPTINIDESSFEGVVKK